MRESVSAAPVRLVLDHSRPFEFISRRGSILDGIRLEVQNLSQTFEESRQWVRACEREPQADELPINRGLAFLN